MSGPGPALLDEQNSLDVIKMQGKAWVGRGLIHQAISWDGKGQQNRRDVVTFPLLTALSRPSLSTKVEDG